MSSMSVGAERLDRSWKQAGFWCQPFWQRRGSDGDNDAIERAGQNAPAAPDRANRSRWRGNYCARTDFLAGMENCSTSNDLEMHSRHEYRQKR